MPYRLLRRYQHILDLLATLIPTMYSKSHRSDENPITLTPVVATTRPTPVIVKTQPAAIVPKSIATSNGGKKDANAVFLGCCKTAKVAKSCERICNFDILNKKVLTGMFLGTDPCPQSYGLELLQCAAQSDDHTACCRSKGVHTTSAGDKCLGFCNMRPGVTFQACNIQLYDKGHTGNVSHDCYSHRLTCRNIYTARARAADVLRHSPNWSLMSLRLGLLK
ncbi:hypothetical protein Y032_0464g1939 [Ancylostoma ceylanicum]|uniref:Domain of unknown function DB domain-containing protein n=1 Tax=Ancylostoma ceylanicum TaxID=53326 RepID=A0A016WZ99_9BILA|nr:hypothetical protein Y032_0464g1939 [Ancylostoma ceylanicum]